MRTELPRIAESVRSGRRVSASLAAVILVGCATSPHRYPPTGASVSGDLPTRTSDLGEESRQRDEHDALSDLIALTRDDTIFTTSARTVDFNGQALVPRLSFLRATGVYDGNERVGDPLDRELAVLVSTLRGVVGLHENVTLTATVPYVHKNLMTRVNGERRHFESSGLGDVSLVAKWRFIKDPELGGTTELAVLGGVKLPTGRYRIRDGGKRLPRPLQPGSGSVDGIVGIALTRLWDGGRWLINADMVFQLNTAAAGYRFGNRLRFDVGAQYRTHPDRYESYDQTTVNLILELNGEYAWRDEVDGSGIPASGGSKLFLSPGVQVIVNEDLLFEAGVQIPVFRDLNGPQLAEDVRTTVGLRWRF